MNYYVYAYLRKTNKTPYYIGKGCRNRFNNKAHNVKVPKDKSLIVFLESNLTNVGACALERRYISWYGRKDLGTVILRNKTDGGEGAVGSKRPDLSKYNRTRVHPFTGTKRKDHSQRMSGSNNPNYGKLTSEETKNKIRRGLKAFRQQRLQHSNLNNAIVPE